MRTKDLDSDGNPYEVGSWYHAYGSELLVESIEGDKITVRHLDISLSLRLESGWKFLRSEKPTNNQEALRFLNEGDF